MCSPYPTRKRTHAKTGVRRHMARNSIDSDIRSRIDVFIQEISGLIKVAAIQSVREALGGDAEPARRGPGRPAGTAPKSATPARRGRARGGKRSSEEVGAMAERIVATVRGNPGQGLESIGKEIGVPTKELKLPVIKLLSDGKLKKTGEKRGTKYFPAGRSN